MDARQRNDLLLRLWAMVVVLVPSLCLLGALASVRSVPWALRRMGSTTLGCYILHFYCAPLVHAVYTLQLDTRDQPSPWPPELAAAIGWPGAGAVTFASLFLWPIVFQLTLGALFHDGFMWHVKMLRVGALRLLDAVRADKMTADDETRVS